MILFVFLGPSLRRAGSLGLAGGSPGRARNPGLAPASLGLVLARGGQGLAAGEIGPRTTITTTTPKKTTKTTTPAARGNPALAAGSPGASPGGRASLAPAPAPRAAAAPAGGRSVFPFILLFRSSHE